VRADSLSPEVLGIGWGNPANSGRIWGLIRKFRTDVREAHETSESCRLTRVTEAVPAENRLDSEYSGDIGDSNRMCPSDPVGGSLSSGTRQHARIGRFRSNAQPRTQKVGLFAAWEGPSAAAAPQAAAVRSLSLAPPRRFLAVVEGWGGWNSEIRNLCKTLIQYPAGGS
jgi:hypothetical protein